MGEHRAVVAHSWEARLFLTGLLLVLGLVIPGAGSAATGRGSSAVPGTGPGFNALPGSLTIPRYGAAAAPLPGGDVLIAGGASSDVTAPGPTLLSSAEVFDPSTGVFTTLPGSMTTARFAPVAAPLPGGDVLIAGGISGSGQYGGNTLSSAELFDPSTGRFTPLPASMTTPRAGAVAAQLPGGDVLIAGGDECCGGPTGTVSTAEVFNPATGVFTALPGSMTTARFLAAAAPLADGDVLIAGGSNASGTLSSAELFDPTTDAFRATGSMTTGRYAPLAAPLANGDVLVAAGGGSSGNTLSSAEVFDPTSGAFTLLPVSMTTGRGAAMAAPLPGGVVLIAGGDISSGAVLSSAEVFDPTPQATITGGQSGSQPVGQPTAQPLLVTNVGVLTPLAITGASLSGVDQSDFKIVTDRCAGRSLAFLQSCTITTQATARARGRRSATLTLQDNEPTPSTVTLTVIGVAEVGRIHLIACKPTNKHHKTECTNKVLTVHTELTAGDRATLTRNHVIYASGSTRNGKLVLRSRRQLAAGHYTLALVHLTAGHWVTTRYQITIH
jgi:hypothetical protein